MTRRTPWTALALLLAGPLTAVAAPRIVVVDAGHGGVDPGGSGNGMQEKLLVIDAALRLRDLLVADHADPAGGGEWTVALTRTDDTFVELAARAAYANDLGAERFFSIHSNAWHTPDANGTSTYSYAEGDAGAALRDRVHEEMIAAWGRKDRGTKTGNLAVLRETAMPAALSEMAFITHVGDAAFLADPVQRQRAALAYLWALQRDAGLAAYEPGAPAANGAVDGTVSGPTGPVAGAAIALGDLSAVSGADGTFAIEGAPAGDGELAVAAEGYAPWSGAVAVVAGQRVSVEVQLVAGVDGDPPDDRDDGDDGVDEPSSSDMQAGCAAGGAGGPLALAAAGLALLAQRARRRSISASRARAAD